MSYHSILLALFCSFFFNVVFSANTCQPSTWQAKRAIATTQAPGSGPRFNYKLAAADTGGDPQPGQVVCRYYGHSDNVVNYYTCTALADFYAIPLSDFFKLNPNVSADCSNIQPSTQYCIRGYIQPLISTDGNCGPNYNNASCRFTDFPCCNAGTWKCGNSTDDCAPGTCWEGSCQGHDIYSVDGKCGIQNNNLLCGGKWGDCCSTSGQCGTGPNFCGDGKCQSGNCTTPVGGYPPPATNNTNDTPDGSCGPAKGYMCNVVWGNCCNKNNTCGSLATDCAVNQGCQNKYGLCGNQTWSTTTMSSTTSISYPPSSSTLSTTASTASVVVITRSKLSTSLTSTTPTLTTTPATTTNSGVIIRKTTTTTT